MAPVIQFKKAVKYDAKGRLALVGPPGSGKSFTMLRLARQLAGPNGKIAAVDTEHGSLSKYADVFGFDVFEMDSYTPENFMAAIAAAEEAKYDVFCCDSLSHFWVGKDGALEFVDLAAKKHRDNMGGWKEFRPHERAMVDAMIASPCHVIVTMRTKTEYVEEVNPSTGKKQRRKVGLAPVQRDGLEYEMDLVGYMDEDNTLIVDKTRCSFYAGKAIAKPGEKDFAPFVEWLKGERRTEPAQQPVATAPPAQTPKPADECDPFGAPPPPPDDPGKAAASQSKQRSADELRKALAELQAEYESYGQLELHDRIKAAHTGGADQPPRTLKQARECVAEMESILVQVRAQVTEQEVA